MSKANSKFTVEEVIAAVKKNRGILTLAAKELGCARQTLHNYVNRYPTVAQAVSDERESLLDLAEGSLFEQVRKGNITAIIFTLKTIGKHRGYVERQEIASTKPITLRVVYEEPNERGG